MSEKKGKGWHIGLWVLQAVLAIAFGMAGAMKLGSPIEELASNMAWVTRVPAELVRFIGAAELLGALGLIVPSASRIRPKLTSLAAAGLVVVMLLAAGHHLMNAEATLVPVNVVLGGLAALIVWGRAKQAPIQPRS